MTPSAAALFDARRTLPPAESMNPQLDPALIPLLDAIADAVAAYVVQQLRAEAGEAEDCSP